ncbi:hypothetical protein GJU39_04065 [Pedobacter petrophilus]|uniref:Uncharacterized protein n=1 Tax=Pedobacter petrophilus TaxID=1908241 RepID=A0A7K0FUJ3_9SPHI|nr:hypothetical protein [Pedobacter petrophilus]MRX75255.1 hypothetical protein [Pedobacter petrophilus]
MRKFFKITAVIILSLLIFFVALFKYRQYQANQVSIPRNAVSVLKISVDEVFKSLAANLISNPGFYLKSNDKQKPTTGRSKLASGLKIPASIYFYFLQNQPKTAVFTRLEIKSLIDFESFIKHTLGFKILKKQNGISFASSSLGNMAICYNNEAAAIVVSSEMVSFEPILIKLLTQENFVKLSESRFNTMNGLTHHIAYSDNKNTFTTDFSTGAINFNANFPTEAIIPAAQPEHRTFNEESTASIWLNADFPTIADKTYRFKNATIARDSLLKYYKGYVDFEWTNSIPQTDSIITYEYNDDFEKVEKITLQKKEVPNFTLNIAAEATGLKNYLSRQKIINLDSGTVDKLVFPLYQAFVGGDNQQFLLGTNNNLKADTKKERSTDFFSLDVNFKKLNTQSVIPGANRYLKSFSKLTMKGKAVNPHQVQLNGKLTLINGDINSLYQLLKDF